VVPYIILSLLHTRPLTGYEIAKRFKTSLIFVWGVHHSQIYSHLRRLEKDGLVSSRLEIQESKPNKRIYELTNHGRQRLAEWLGRPPQFYSLKDEMLLKAFSLDLVPTDEATRLFDGQIEAHQKKLRHCLDVREMLQKRYGPVDTSPDRVLRCRYITVDHLVRYETMYLEWCRWAKDLLRRHPATSGESRVERFRDDVDDI